MIDNPWRRVVLVLLLAGLGSFYLLTRGLKLGLDLQGGTRLVYTVDIEKAIADGDLPKDAKAEQVIPETDRHHLAPYRSAGCQGSEHHAGR